MWYRAARLLGQILCIVGLNYRLYGVHRLPRRGGVLLAANHQSFLDPILFGIGLPRPMHFMARESLFRNPLFGLLIRTLHAFPVRRGSADRAAIRHAIQLLQRGEVVLVFPEATRSTDGEIGQPQGGLAMIAARAGVPIVPAVVEGAFRAWPRRHRLPRPARIQVLLGEPISPEAFSGRPHEETAALLRQRFMDLQRELRSKPCR